MECGLDSPSAQQTDDRQTQLLSQSLFPMDTGQTRSRHWSMGGPFSMRREARRWTELCSLL